MNTWPGRPAHELDFIDCCIDKDFDGSSIYVDSNMLRLLDSNGKRIVVGSNPIARVQGNTLQDIIESWREK